MASAGDSSSAVRQPWTTTLPPRPSTAAMSRSGPTASLSSRANATSTSPPLKSDDPRITFVAPIASVVRARSIVRMPPPTRHGSAAQILATSAAIVPLALGGIEIDQLHLGIAREPRRPTRRRRLSPRRASRPGRAGRSGRPGGRSKESASDWNAPGEQVVLELGDGMLGKMEDRRRQRGVGFAPREDLGEVLERAGAARRDDRDATPPSTRPRSARSRSRRACRRDRSTSAAPRRRRGPRPPAPTRPHRVRSMCCRCGRRRRIVRRSAWRRSRRRPPGCRSVTRAASAVPDRQAPRC